MINERANWSEGLKAHQRACYALALHLTGNPADAQDVCQEAFSRVARQGGAGQGIRDFRSWVLRIVVCTHHDLRDSEIARHRREERYARQLKIATPTKQSEAEREELRDHLNAALRRLRAEQRLPIVLHYEEGLSYAQAAAVLALPEGTVKTNIHRGLEELRGLLARSGYAAGVPALVTALSQRSPLIVPSSLTPFIHELAIPGASGLRKATPLSAPAGSGLVLGWKTVAGISFALLAALAGYSGLAAWGPVGSATQSGPTGPTGPRPSFVPLAGEEASAEERDLTPALIPRNAWAYPVFDQLRREGLRIALLGPRIETFRLRVPAELRFKAVTGRELVEGVAKFHRLKTLWLDQAKGAILYRGGPAPAIEQFLKDLRAPAAATRALAVWRAGSIADPQVVSPLVAAAGSGDGELSRQAVGSLKRLGWPAAVVLEPEKTLELLVKEVENRNWRARAEAASALGLAGGAKALALLERLLLDPDLNVRKQAVLALSQGGDERGLALLKKIQDGEDRELRGVARIALAVTGLGTPWGAEGGANPVAGVSPLAPQDPAAVKQRWDLIDQALGDKSATVRLNVGIPMLADAGGAEALPRFQKVLADEDPGVQRAAVEALGKVGGEKALALVQKALDDQNASVRAGAACALEFLGVSGTLPLLEKALSDQDAAVRGNATSSLDQVSGGQALALLEKALADPDAHVRQGAVRALWRMDQEKALPLLGKALGDPHPGVVCTAVSTLGLLGDERSLGSLEKVLTDGPFQVRSSAATALGQIGGTQARELLLRRLGAEQEDVAKVAIRDALRYRWTGDPAVEKALAETKLPEKSPAKSKAEEF